MALSLGSPSSLPPHDDHNSAHPMTRAPSNLALSLSLVKSILDATDTLPCVKYVASVGVTIIEVVQVCRTGYPQYMDANESRCVLIISLY